MRLHGAAVNSVAAALLSAAADVCVCISNMHRTFTAKGRIEPWNHTEAVSTVMNFLG